MADAMAALDIPPSGPRRHRISRELSRQFLGPLRARLEETMVQPSAPSGVPLGSNTSPAGCVWMRLCAQGRVPGPDQRGGLLEGALCAEGMRGPRGESDGGAFRWSVRRPWLERASGRAGFLGTAAWERSAVRWHAQHRGASWITQRTVGRLPFTAWEPLAPYFNAVLYFYNSLRGLSRLIAHQNTPGGALT